MSISNDRIVWLDHAAATALVTSRYGPSPITDYRRRRSVACPECGAVRKPCSTLRYCLSCSVRLMGEAELRWRAEVWRAMDYVNMAAWIEEIAERMGE